MNTPTRARRGGRPDAEKQPAKPRRYARWRALTLAGVYGLMALHILHWRLAGRTLAPLELNEVMYTLELGIVTAGFLFMAAAVAATAVFGRFFCSWGCHILALEDLAAWLLAKIRVRPRPVRSRMLAWVPFLAMFYMFIWPHVARVASGAALPEFHARTDAHGWASFVTTNFWRNLPGPGVTILTFVVCGFLMVYILGSRAFCTYACPYGAIFRVADRFAPGRIMARGDCSRCGQCTAVCQSRVRVHEELAAYGRVVDPACLKDLDCVAACPAGNVTYGMSRPSLFQLPIAAQRPRFEFTIAEDLLMGGVFLACLFVVRGLYGLVPFLLALAIAGIVSFTAVVGWRLVVRPEVRFNHTWLRREGRLTHAGRAFAACGVMLLLLGVHSAFIRYHEFLADRNYASLHPLLARAPDQVPYDVATQTMGHLEAACRWGLLKVPEETARLAGLHGWLGERLANANDLPGALRHMETAALLRPDDARSAYNLAVMLSALDRPREAIPAYQRVLQLAPDDADAHNNLGLTLAGTGDLAAARYHLETAIRLRADFAQPHLNLGQLLWLEEETAEARRQFEIAGRLEPAFAPAIAEMIRRSARHETPPRR